MFMKEVVDGEQGGALGKSYDVDITYASAFKMFGGSLDVLDIILIVGGFSKFVTCFHCLIVCPCTCNFLTFPSHWNISCCDQCICAFWLQKSTECNPFGRKIEFFNGPH